MTAKFPSTGEIFEDTYRIEAILGSGGFARVYRAIEVGLERPVALKILRPPVNTSQSDSQRDTYLETLMERFQREAMMLSRLRSPYTVNLYKYGKTQDGLLYMALEYIDGLSLAEILRSGKPIAPFRVVKILKQVLSSLHEAHSLGMLHRDLKPANIMVFEHLGETDQVKLLDFGIAKLVRDAPTGEPQQDLTSDGTLIGTPRYMAPEQIQGDAIGPPADIYALGLVAYELLTGERAIKGESSIQIIGKQLAPQSFRLPLSAAIPAGVRNVVNRMIEKDISARFRSCDEVIELLTAPEILLFEDSDVTEIDAGEFVPYLDADIEVEIETLENMPLPETQPQMATPALGFQDVTPTSFELPHEFRIKPTRRPTLLIIGGVLVALVMTVAAAAITVTAMTSADEEEVTEQEPVATNAEDPVGDDESEFAFEAPKEATVLISARVNGKAVDGATVFVNGVEKGVTPLTLPAEEVPGTVTIRYAAPDSDQVFEDKQEVTTPRDVTAEFAPVLVVKPQTKVEEERPAEREPKVQKKEKTEPRRTPQKRKQTPRTEPKPKKSIYEKIILD